LRQKFALAQVAACWLTLMLVALVTASDASAQAVTHVGSQRFSVTISGHTLKIPYDANQSITSAHSSVVRLVVLVHGGNRHCDTALSNMQSAASTAGVNNTTSLLVGPQFLIEDDITANSLASDMLFWDSDGWKQGDQSLSTSAHPRPANVSTFAVMDSMLLKIASLCPNLKTIVIGGHSSGGQFTTRYAAGNRVEQVLAQQYGIKMSYVVANPSSYMYLNSERLVTGTTNTWAIPVNPPCSDYNTYKYGMSGRDPYMAAVPGSQIISQFSSRKITDLLGEDDINPADSDLDTRCPAEMEGAYRLIRGLNFRNYLIHYYGPSILSVHSTMTVPGVAHDSNAMFTSSCGVYALFGFGSCSTTVSVQDAPRTPGDALQHAQLTCAPNPVRNQATIAFAVPNGQGPATVSVFDVRGRLVRGFTTELSSGKGSLVWDGRSNSGRDLSSGVYFVKLDHPGGTVKTAVVLLR